MDLTKAFDSILHPTLREAISFGVQEVGLNWLRSYLNERKQYVDVAYESEFNCFVVRSIKIEYD